MKMGGLGATFQVKEFATVRIFSNDVLKSKEWYKSLFNQEPIEESDIFVSFKIAGVCLDITLPDAKNPFSSGGSIGYWYVDDIYKVLEVVKQIGGQLYRGPLKVPETQRTIMQVKDPFGNVIGFECPIEVEQS